MANMSGIDLDRLEEIAARDLPVLRDMIAQHRNAPTPSDSDCARCPLDEARLERAERALRNAGFQDHGGQDWTPPLGQPPRVITVVAPDPVVEANRQLLLERSRVGVEKYGVTLAAADLSRDELVQHALEEALDLANYLQALLKC